MKHHFKRPKSKLAARKKRDLWAGRSTLPPPPLEKRHRWIGGRPQTPPRKAERELRETLAAERAGILTAHLMNTDERPQPDIVRLRILTRKEWDAIDPALQATLETQTRMFIAEYGERFLSKDIERHRSDLSLAYGVCV
jgi:hypothetical protein